MSGASNGGSRGGPDDRNAFARLDLAILALEEQQRVALDLKRDATYHAERVGEIKADLMDIRRAMRPLLDPGAPVEIK